MKKSGVRLAAAVMVAGAFLALTSCFYMPGVSGRPAKAGLSINRSLLPANVSSIAVVVGGPGMQPIMATYPVGTTSATLTVPSGVARTFTLLANTQSVTFRDDATVDLAPDEAKQIDLAPKLFATQIIVPDTQNGRLVRVSDMKGAGWTSIEDTELGLYPVDVDFDDQGQIYVATNDRGILVLDETTGAFASVGEAMESNICSIAIDRVRGLLYYVWTSEGYYLSRVSLTSGVAEQIDLGSVTPYMSDVQGIAVDSDGFVYIANNATYPGEILKITPDPSSSTLQRSYSGSALGYPYDVLVKGDYIYVSDQDGQIVQLDKNLSFVNSFSGPASDPLLGPMRFVATLNAQITVTTEGYYPDLYDYKAGIVSFGDMNGAGWTRYGTMGSDQDQFSFLAM